METILKFREDEPVNWSYDEEGDVLYISFGQPKPAIAIDSTEGVILLRTPDDGELVGITIIGVSDMLKRKATRTPSRSPAK